MLFLLLVINSLISSQALVTPNTASTTSEIYDTTIPNEYENDLIRCRKSECIVICDTLYGCNEARINAGASQQLSLICSGEGSCRWMNITSSASLSTTISCTNQSSCFQASFNVGDSTNVNLTCDYGETLYNDAACYNLNLNAERSMNLNVQCIHDMTCNLMEIHCPLNNKCNILCSSSYSVCSGMSIYVKDKYSDTNLDCNGRYACDAIQMYCGGELKTSTSRIDSLYCIGDDCTRWGCRTNECCPLSFYKKIIQCNTASCTIYCTTENCANYLIDGSSATSKLTLDCDSTNGGCVSAHILCPTNNDAICTVNCHGLSSCEYAFIKATNAYSLDVICNHCSYSAIYCPIYVNENGGHCTVNCTNQGSCWRTKIKADNSYSLDLICGPGSCWDADVFCPYHRMGACNIDCSTNNYNCQSMDIWVMNNVSVYNFLNINCPNTDNNKACSDVYFWCDYDGDESNNYYTSYNIPWSRFDFNSDRSEYQCHVTNDSAICCPWKYTSDGTVQTIAPTIATTEYPTVSTQIQINNPSPIPTIPPKYTLKPSKTSNQTQSIFDTTKEDISWNRAIRIKKHYICLYFMYLFFSL